MSLTRNNSNVSYKREFKCLWQERFPNVSDKRQFKYPLTRESQEKIQMSLIRDYSNVFDMRIQMS